MQIDEHLVWRVGQGMPKILSQCPFKNSIGSDFFLVIEENSPNRQIKICTTNTIYLCLLYMYTCTYKMSALQKSNKAIQFSFINLA